MLRVHRWFPVFAALALVACGGSDGPTDPGNGGNDPPGETRAIKDTPSFAADVQEIFDRRGCSAGSCHGAAAAANLDLRASASFAALVNVASFQDGNEVRVIPGNAQNSYLVEKVEGRQTVGSTMPPNGSPLDQIDRTNLRNWIDNGAENN